MVYIFEIQIYYHIARNTLETQEEICSYVVRLHVFNINDFSGWNATHKVTKNITKNFLFVIIFYFQMVYTN